MKSAKIADFIAVFGPSNASKLLISLDDIIEIGS